MKIVCKKSIPFIPAEHKVKIPCDAQFISLGMQWDEITVWFECEHPWNELEEVKLLAIFTDQPFNPEDTEFIGTVQHNRYVMHVYRS